MKKWKLDLHRFNLAYDVNVKSLLNEQKEERNKFFQDIERNNIARSGIAYTKTLDLLLRHIEARTSVYFKSLFDIIPADSEFEPGLRHEIVSAIDNFVNRAVVEVKILIEARISSDQLGRAVRDSILNDLNSRSLKIKSHFRKKAQLEFLVRKSKDSKLQAKAPKLLQQLRWIKGYGWKYKWYILVAVILVVAYPLLCGDLPGLISTQHELM